MYSDRDRQHLAKFGTNLMSDIGLSLLKILRNLCVGKKQQLEPYMEQQTGSSLGKGYVKATDCHPDFLTYMQIASCNMPGKMKHKLESRLRGEISITSDADDTTLMAESEEELKNLVMKVNEESKKKLA